MSRPRRFVDAVTALMLMVLSCAGGCSAVQNFFKTDRSRLLAPEKLIKQPVGTPINPIFGSIGPVDTTRELVPNATFPREGDWTYTAADYVIGPTDIVDIAILDLFQIGLETVLRRQVSASGFIDLPLLAEPVKAEGLTQDQLKADVIKAYSAEILRDPTITVTVVGRRQSRFSILGAVARPSQYEVIRKDLRLLEAIAMAGGVTQVNIRYIYVIRPAPAVRIHVEKEPVKPEPAPAPPKEIPAPLPEAPPETQPETLPLPPEEKPTEQVPPGPPKETPIDVEKALRELGTVLPGTKPPTRPAEQPAPAVIPHFTETDSTSAARGPATREVQQIETTRTHKWVYTADGKWVEVAQDASVATQPSGAGAPPVHPAGMGPQVAETQDTDPFGWRKLDKSELTRIIAIDLGKLRAGDPRMNIIVRDNDIIRIPTHQIGEFYVTGEVLRPGVYSMMGRRVTVKMAMAAVGNLGPVAWPENSVLIRRVGDNQEQVFPLNIEAIFRGEQPDIFLKPDDQIAVGTDPRAIFYAVMRNAFRMTYGVGVIYDRNVASPVLAPLTSRRFKRW